MVNMPWVQVLLSLQTRITVISLQMPMWLMVIGKLSMLSRAIRKQQQRLRDRLRIETFAFLLRAVYQVDLFHYQIRMLNKALRYLLQDFRQQQICFQINLTVA